MTWKNTLTSIVDNNINNKIIITPNPIKDTMEINGLDQPVKNISLYDLKGNLVYTKSDFITNDNMLKLNLNLNFLIHGTYLLKVKTKSSEYTSKFVKE